MRKIGLFILLFVTLPITGLTVPMNLSHQGHILQNDGNPVTGSANVIFNIYDNEQGGSTLWAQTLSVSFDNGFYNVILGPGSPELSTELFDGANLYLGLTLEGMDEFSPRAAITSVPYAFRAGSVTGEVNALGGLTVDGAELVDSDGNLYVPGTFSVNGQPVIDETGTISAGTLNITDMLQLPLVESGDLPTASEENRGQVVYASDVNSLYYSNGTEWVNLEIGGSVGIEIPRIDSVEPPVIAGGVQVTLTINGQAFEEGCEVIFNEQDAISVSFVNSNEINVETPELESGAYTIRLTNPNGLRTTLEDGLVVDNPPSWITESGSLGFIVDSADGPHMTFEAEDPEGQPLTFSLTSGALPPGVSLEPDTGVLTGNPEDVESDIEYTFEITIADGAPTPNTIAQTFSLVVTHLIGQDPNAPGDSCKNILELQSSIGDGVYWVDPGGSGGDDPFQVYCDMTEDGGGWTLVYKWSHTQDHPRPNVYSTDYLNTCNDPYGDMDQECNIPLKWTKFQPEDILWAEYSGDQEFGVEFMYRQIYTEPTDALDNSENIFPYTSSSHYIMLEDHCPSNSGTPMTTDTCSEPGPPYPSRYFGEKASPGAGGNAEFGDQNNSKTWWNCGHWGYHQSASLLWVR